MNKLDLSIGNLFYICKKQRGEVYAPEPIPFKVMYITYRGIQCTLANKDLIDDPLLHTVMDKYISPIPISESILKDLGFKCVDHKHRDGSISEGVFKLENIVLVFKTRCCTLSVVEPGNPFKDYNWVTTVECVHQVQNFYKLINDGVELTLPVKSKPYMYEL